MERLPDEQYREAPSYWPLQGVSALLNSCFKTEYIEEYIYRVLLKSILYYMFVKYLIVYNVYWR